MLHDCGITKSDEPLYEPAFETFYRGWHPNQDITELLVLVHTPGISLQWVYAALKLSAYYRTKLKVARNEASVHICQLGHENAASVRQGDGYRMLRVLDHRRVYRGQAPLWSTLELQADPRSDRLIAKDFGVSEWQITSWRTSLVFDPLTGSRLRREVGNPRAAEMHLARGSLGSISGIRSD